MDHINWLILVNIYVILHCFTFQLLMNQSEIQPWRCRTRSANNTILATCKNTYTILIHILYRVYTYIYKI